MTVDVRWARPGADLARTVSAIVRELQGDDPLQLVRVVAADAATVDGLRRALPLTGGACGVEIGGTLRLARTIAAPVLGARRSASPVAVLAAVQQVLADPTTCPAAFASCASHPATHDALVRSARSLTGAFTLPDPRQALRELAGGRESASALCEVVGAVRTRLIDGGAVDDALVLTTATERVAAGLAQSADTPLVLVVTQQFPPAHVAFLRVLCAHSPRAVVVAASTRDATVSVAHHVARLTGTEPEVVVHEPTSMATTVVSCPDHDEEVREVTRRVVALLDQGVPADRIAVLYPPQGPHRAAIGSSLSAAGIAARGEVAPRLGGAAAGQVLRLLLTLVTDGLDRNVLIEVARLAPLGAVSAPDDPPGAPARAAMRYADSWNRLASRNGVLGEDDWPAFEALELADDDRDARDHAGLCHFLQSQRRHRNAVRAATSWASAGQALERWFTAHCGTVDWRRSHWLGHASWQHEAAEQLEALITELSDIDVVGLPFTVRTLQSLVSAGLDLDVVTAESKGAGVVVDQVVGGAGIVVDHVFVVGANDHLLPGRVVDDLVITRQHGPEPFGVLTGPANRPLRDRRGLLAALDGAGVAVTITHARWDVRSGGDLYVSRLVPTEGITPVHVASHAAQVMSPDAPWLSADEWLTREPQRSTPRLSRRRRSVTARLQDQPGPYDGQVGPLGDLTPFLRTGPDGDPKQIGITSLERWVQCGLEYFVHRVLDAPPDDVDATDIADVEPMEKGTLVHTVAERLVAEWLDTHPGDPGPWIATQADVDAVFMTATRILDDEAAGPLAAHRLGHPEMWRARRAQLLAALRRGIEDERTDAVTPVEPEFAFGSRSDGRRPAVVWTSPDGERRLHFSGAIDRLDRRPDGTLRVLDVKSGKRDSYTTITPLLPLGDAADKLQLAFYGWAAEQLLGEPVTGATYRFTGHQDVQRDVVLELDDAVMHTLHERIDEITAAIADGRFVPGEVGNFGCPVCTPDQLGLTEINQRRIEWAVDDDVSDDNDTDVATAAPEQLAL
ncbi:MAG: PD-(D/E)XK nuclease family protein [Ilumatobacteraceae bacterium]